MDLKDVKLAVAVPHRMGHCHIVLARTLTISDLTGVQTMIFYNSDTSIARNRNALVQIFLDHEFRGTHMLFLDTDIAVPRDGIRKLLEADKDIISGMYTEKSPQCRIVARKRIGRYDYSEDTDWLSKYPAASGGPIWIIKDELRDKVVECDATGAGCLLVKREVYEKIGYPWFFEEFNPEARRHDRKSMISEDVGFFQKAAEAGYKAYLHTGVRCEHWSEMTKFPPFWDEPPGRAPQRGG